MSVHPDVKSADAFTRAARRIRRTGGDDLASGVFVGYNPAGNTTAFAHDELARCTSLAFLTGTNPLLSIAYAYDEGDRRTNETWSTGRTMAYGYDDAHQLTSVSASRPSDVARYRYDAAGNPVDRAELGLDITNSFNNLNQIVTGSWTGATLAIAGSVNYPLGFIFVRNISGKTRKRFHGKVISKQTNTKEEKQGPTKMKQRSTTITKWTVDHGAQKDRAECR